MNQKNAFLHSLKNVIDTSIFKISRKLIGQLSKIKLNDSSSRLEILRFIIASLSIKLLGCWDVLGRIRFVSQFRQFKTSDTLFILGCGDSLNDLTESQWNHLNRCDVAGLSYSCLLDIKQTFHFIERPYRFGRENRLFLQEQLFARYKAEKIKNIIWKSLDYKEKRPLDLSIVPEFNTLLEANIYLKDYGNSQLDLQKKIIKQILNLNLHQHIFFLNLASLFSLALFGVGLNYKNIVFIGIDLNGSDYFFYNEEKFPQYAELTRLHRSQREIKYGSETAFHATANPDKGIPVDNLLEILVEQVKNVNFYTASSKSKLARFLDVYDFGDRSKLNEGEVSVSV
jgi:hypothetical protein